MNHDSSRIISFLLAFIMVFSMGLSSFADGIDNANSFEEVTIDEEIPYSEKIIENTETKDSVIDKPISELSSDNQGNLNDFAKLEIMHLDASTGELISKDIYDLEIGKEIIPTDYILEEFRDKFMKSSSPEFIITEDSSFILYYEKDVFFGENPDNLTMDELSAGEAVSSNFTTKRADLKTMYSTLLRYNSDSREWPNQGAINLSKVAEPVQGSTNLWEVTLKIEGKNLLTTSDIVLVLDKSGSMSGEKISNLKLAAKEFVDNLLLPDGVNRIALVTFDNGATVKSNFVDYSGKTTLNNAINGITASGGTNMQAGIHVAQTLLDSSNATNKVMVLLGDGQPTYSYKVIDATGITLSNHNRWSNPNIIISNPQIVAVDYSQVVGNGSSFNISKNDSYQVICTVPNHNHGPFDSGFPNNHGIPTIFEANLAKDKGTQIYSIAFNADSNGQNVLNNSQNAGYYQINSTDLSSLNAVFSEISGKISYAAKNGIVTDPMGDMFDLASSELDIYASQGSIQIQGNSIIWNTGNIAEGNPAILKYLVRIKAGADANILYPTNQETVFSYTDVYENDTSKNFPIPEVSIGGGRIVLIGYEVNENGEPINSEGVIVDRPDLANIIYNRNYSNNPLSYNQTYTITPDNLDGYEYQKYLWNGNEGNENTLQILLLANKPTETVYFGYYKIKTVTVTFNENYPGSNVYTKNINKGSSLGSEMPADPQRIGYTFTGWNTEPNGTGSVFSSSTIVNQNITVYAQWQKNIGPELQIEGYTGEYDGLEHSITVGNIVEGDTVYYTKDGDNWTLSNPKFKDAGEYTVYVKVVNPNYEDRTGSAKVTITKRDITIKAHSATKAYDGTPLTANGYEIVTGSFVEGEGFASVTVEGSQTLVGTSDNTITGYTFKDNTKSINYNVITQEGTLTVTKAQGEELELAGYTGVYDGEEHSITVVNLVDGDTVYYTKDGEDWTLFNPKFKDVGEYTVYVKVVNPNYENREGSATVTITKRDITIKAQSATKAYDGTPLTANGYEIVSGIFVGEEGFESVTVEGSQTLVGTSSNKITGYTFKDNTKSTNYNVITQDGTLTVTKAQTQITITAQSATKVYDGTPLTANGYELTGTLLTGDEIEVTVTGTITDVGTVVNEITEVKITHEGTDVTENYDITKVNGTLEITEKEVTITVDSKTKVYGTIDPTFTGTVEGLINENDLGVLIYNES